MTKLLAAILVLVSATMGSCYAQSHSPDAYLQSCSVALASNQRGCMTAARSFPDDLAAAWHADYQAIRKLSYCLTSGCDGAVRINEIEACAWRKVASAIAPTEADKLLEAGYLRAYCASVDKDQVDEVLRSMTKLGFSSVPSNE